MKKNEVDKRLADRGIEITALASRLSMDESMLRAELNQDEISDDILNKIDDVCGEKTSIFFGNNNEIGNNNDCSKSNDTIMKLLEMIERKDKEIKELNDRIIKFLEANAT